MTTYYSWTFMAETRVSNWDLTVSRNESNWALASSKCVIGLYHILKTLTLLSGEIFERLGFMDQFGSLRLKVAFKGMIGEITRLLDAHLHESDDFCRFGEFRKPQGQPRQPIRLERSEITGSRAYVGHGHRYGRIQLASHS